MLYGIFLSFWGYEANADHILLRDKLGKPLVFSDKIKAEKVLEIILKTDPDRSTGDEGHMTEIIEFEVNDSPIL